MLTSNLPRTADSGPIPAATPRLLVSVRSWAEATQAIAGGAEILDIKEPASGSLGMADLSVINNISQQILADGKTTPLSVALGELHDWIDRNDVPKLPERVAFAKLGLSELGGQSDWPLAWRLVRKQFDSQRAVPLRWVAVAYADQESANSPVLEDVLGAAAASGCAGLLIDTFSKNGRTLLDVVSVSKLAELAEQCHGSGMFMALAGSLTLESLHRLGSTSMDIVAIRSAACRNANRRDTVDAALVSAFRTALVQVTGRP